MPVGAGKGGGVKLANSPTEVKQLANTILGMRLVTPQTGPEGKLVRKVLIAEAAEIEKEFYLAILLDRETSRLTLIGSEEGGVNIEEVAERTPEKIIRTQNSSGFRFNRLPSTGVRIQTHHRYKLPFCYPECHRIDFVALQCVYWMRLLTRRD